MVFLRNQTSFRQKSESVRRNNGIVNGTAAATLQTNRHIRRQADDAVFYREVFRMNDIAFADAIFKFFRKFNSDLIKYRSPDLTSTGNSIPLFKDNFPVKICL